MPIVNGLEDKSAGGINVVQLDAAEGDNAALQEQYGLRGHPSFEETLRTMFALGNGDFYPVGAGNWSIPWWSPTAWSS